MNSFYYKLKELLSFKNSHILYFTSKHFPLLICGKVNISMNIIKNKIAHPKGNATLPTQPIPDFVVNNNSA